MSKISSIGKKILEAIKNQRLTKKFIYEKMGISRGTLDNWISGETIPDHVELETMSKILNIDLLSKSEPEVKKTDVKLIPSDVWEELQANNAVFKVEIDRLWSLVNRLTAEPVRTNNG